MKRETLEEAVKNYCIKKYSVWVSDSDKSDDFINGAKWQAERMYSEEEVKFIISEALQSALVKVDLEQWFKQFKHGKLPDSVECPLFMLPINTTAGTCSLCGGEKYLHKA